MRSVNNAAATVPVATMFFAFFVEASTGLCESNLEGGAVGKLSTKNQGLARYTPQ